MNTQIHANGQNVADADDLDLEAGEGEGTGSGGAVTKTGVEACRRSTL